MSGSVQWRLVPLEKFHESLAEALGLFGKSTEQQNTFKTALAFEIQRIQENPRFGHSEGWADKSFIEGYEFRKLEFGAKGLSGGLSQWRLMYFLDLTEPRILLFWVYSHTQFAVRPDPKYLRKEIQKAFGQK
jgi:hypothetical protein